MCSLAFVPIIDYLCSKTLQHHQFNSRNTRKSCFKQTNASYIGTMNNEQEGAPRKCDDLNLQKIYEGIDEC